MMFTYKIERTLKSVLLDAMAETLNTKAHPFLNRVIQTTSDVWGKEIRRQLVLEEGGVSLVSTLKNLYATIDIPLSFIEKYNRTLSIDSLLELIQDQISLLQIQLSSNLTGDGDGFLTTITEIEEDKYYCDSFGFHAGQKIKCTNAAGLFKGEFFIKSCSPANKYITFNGYVNINKGDKIYDSDERTHLSGIDSIFSKEETLYGVKRKEFPFLNGVTVKAKKSQGMSSQILNALRKVSSNGAETDMILTSFDAKWDLAKESALLTPGAAIAREGDFVGHYLYGIPLFTDKTMPKGAMYLLETKDWEMHQLCDWRWLEDENGKILRKKPNSEDYQATLVKYVDLMCIAPNKQCKIIFE